MGLSDVAAIFGWFPPPPPMTYECQRCRYRFALPQGTDLKRFEAEHAKGCTPVEDPGLLTPAEFAIIGLLSDAAERFGRLPEHHPNERDEFAGDIHRLQRQVMARAARRAYPDHFTPMVRR